MNSSTMNLLRGLGAVLILLGVIGFAIPIFTTQQTRDVVSVGDIKLQTTENVSYVIPPIASAAAVGVGALLLLAGGVFRRN